MSDTTLARLNLAAALGQGGFEVVECCTEGREVVLAEGGVLAPPQAAQRLEQLKQFVSRYE